MSEPFRSTVWAVVLATLTLSLTTRSRAWTGPAGETTGPGSSFDAAPFAFPLEDQGHSWGIAWTDPRKIRRVVVEFNEPRETSMLQKIRLQYWHATWDAKPEPIVSEKGAGGVGWEQMDDWTNGQWKEADTTLDVQGQRLTFTFAPTGAKEFSKLGLSGVAYRKTLKVRIISEQPMPKPALFQVFTDAVYQPMTARILFGEPAHAGIQVSETESGHLEIFNGKVLNVRPINSGAVHSGGPAQWTLPAKSEAGIEADLLIAVDPVSPLYDRTIVTVRSKDRPFSFAADEVARGERILVNDLGVLVVRANDPISLEGYRHYRQEFAGRTVYDRIFDQPEQTLPGAWKDMPLKRPLYFVHGMPGNRNAMHQNPDGGIVITAGKRWFKIPPSPRDTDSKLWAGERLQLGFGFPSDHHVNRRALKDGYLPLLSTWYQDGALSYEQRTLMNKLEGELDEIKLDDPTVLLMHVRIINRSATDQGEARLCFSSTDEDGEEPLSISGNRVQAVWKDKPRLRYLARNLEPGKLDPQGNGLRWTLRLQPGQAHDLYFLIPAITLDSDHKIDALAQRDFPADMIRVCDFWQKVTARGTVIKTPEPWLNNFFRTHLRHLLVNCYKEISSDRLHAHVGTFSYGVYPDESVMMISDLDRRGYHDEARRCYNSFLHYQGSVGMPGNFKSKDGTFYGSGGHDMGGYNKSHGWVMWGMAEHWKFTRDRRWMEQAAPGLIASCEWVIRERKTTMTPNPDGTKPLHFGFLPTGSLEDVTDYWHWLVTNVCTDWGFQALALALAEFGHPEAARLQQEAREFHEDLRAGLEESRILAPVVRLRDGTYVPKYPSRLYERGRSHGWLRETLEGSIHLLITRLLDLNSPQAEWILKDYEDNLYVSEGFGYAIPSFDAFWFSRGGFSMQANLLGGPLPYLYRDEIKHFLRAYFNSFASAFYPDTGMCNEHSLPELGYPAGDHFKSSDEAQSTYWLRLMFVHERDGDLYLGQAIPRYWLAHGQSASIERAASHYGTLSLQIVSRVAEGKIQAKASLGEFPARPKNIYLRLRHPEGKPIKEVTVNGKWHAQIDRSKDWIILPGSTSGTIDVVAHY